MKENYLAKKNKNKNKRKHLQWGYYMKNDITLKIIQLFLNPEFLKVFNTLIWVGYIMVIKNNDTYFSLKK